MINYRVSGFVSGTEQLREALSNTLIVSGARLSELADGLPHLRIEPRVGNGLSITTDTATVAGYTVVEISKISVALQSGGGLAFNGNGELYATGGAGAGDVVGPAGATDNALARFNSTTGKLIKNSVGLLTDAGVLSGLTGLIVGTDPGGSEALRVGTGGIRTSGTIYATDFVITGGSSGSGLQLDELSDVVITGATTGQVLQFNGTNWVNATTAGSSRGSTAFDGAAELVTSTTSANQVVLNLAAATYRSVKYQVQVMSGSSYQATELLAVHDGSTTYVTEYAALFSGVPLATCAVDLSGGNMRLLVTPANAVTTIKVAYTAVTV